MGDLIATLVLVGIVGIAAYTAGKNDAAARVCDERESDGRYVLQRVELIGHEDERMKLMVSNHNRIIDALCQR